MSYLKPIKLDDYKPYSWQVEHIEMHIHLHPDRTTITGRLYILPNPRGPASDALYLNGVNLNLQSLSINNVSTEFTTFIQKNGDLNIRGLAREPQIIETTVIIQPENNLSLSGLYLSNSIFCTQCEAESFRRITYFPDRPDVLSKFTTTIVSNVEKYPVVLCNGNLIAQRKLENNEHMHIWHDPIPKPCYLFALVAGNLVVNEDQFITQSKKSVALKIFSEPGNAHLCEFAMESLKQSMRWDEENYGLEYDLDVFHIVAVDDFNSGAMENKSLNIFNSKYILANLETATDQDFINVQAVVGHEYFHNWSGNRVTCRDWFQLSLKEGLTVFREQQFCADFNSPVVKRIQDVRLLRALQFGEDKSPLSHPVQPSSYIAINNFYTYTVYEKGAEIIRMCYHMLGKKHWRKAMDDYFTRFDGQAVTIEDFIDCLSDASDFDFKKMLPWYTQKGTPEVVATWEYQDSINGFTLHLKQDCAHNPDYQSLLIPVKISWIELEKSTKSQILYFEYAEQTFDFPDLSPSSIPSLLQGFSAPVELKADYSIGDMLCLIAHDNDLFNRWQTIQNLFARTVLQKLPLADNLAEIWAHIIDNAKIDWAFAAEALAPPKITQVADQMKKLDADFLHNEYHSLLRTVSKKLLPKLRQIVQTSNSEMSSKAIGRRQFNHQVLWLMSFSGDPSILPLCEQKYHQAENMTDRICALESAINADPIKANNLLDVFYRQFCHQSLLMDKWLSLQACALKGNVLDNVKYLSTHRDFNSKNPNKIYALLLGFARNFSHFHHRNGSGYRFIGQWVETIDQFNPQVAARLAKSFADFDKCQGEHRTHMQAEIARLSAQNLSNNVLEVVGFFSWH